MPTTRYELKTFADIVSAVMEELKVQSSDLVSKNRIKRDINIIYQNEVVPYEQWKWLRGHVTLSHEARFTTGTCAVAQNSTTVTLTTAPAHSRKGYYFVVDGTGEMYRVKSHTANSATLELDAAYVGSTVTAGTFKIWTDKLALPVDCRDTVQVTHDALETPLESVGVQQFRRYQAAAPAYEGVPRWYCTSDYVDPAPYASVSGLPALSTAASDGLVRTLVFASSITDYISVGDRIEVSASTLHHSFNGEFVAASVSGNTLTYTGILPLAQSAAADATLSVKKLSVETVEERHKELWIYPAQYTTRVVLHVDYTKECPPLVEDADEPLMPVGDRTVLLYGALMRAWAREQDETASTRNATMYQRKLEKMAGKLDDSTDLPIIRPSKTYIGAKRVGQRSRQSLRIGWGGSGSSSSGGSSSSITGTANRAAVFDATGTLIASTTIDTTELGLLDGLTAPLVTTTDTQTLSNKSIDADQNTITNIDNADIKNGANIALSKLAAVTADRALVSDGSGVVSASAITATEITYLDDFVPLTTVALADNQVAAANVFTYTAASFNASVVEYSISRGAGNREVGQLMIATDGTSVNLTQVTSQLGTVGVTLSADVSAGSVRVRYTSTSTGTAPTFKYIQRRWA